MCTAEIARIVVIHRFYHNALDAFDRVNELVVTGHQPNRRLNCIGRHVLSPDAQPAVELLSSGWRAALQE
jgi:hypothetical protein